MRKIVLTGAVAAALSLSAVGAAEAGCYRLGLTGYHWYRYCVGPHFLYPHHRGCTWRYGHRECYYH